MTKAKPHPVWHISNLEREVATGKVTTVHYTVDLQDDTYSAGAYGSIGVDGEISVPFKDLTEAVCIGWVKDQLGEEKLRRSARHWPSRSKTSVRRRWPAAAPGLAPLRAPSSRVLDPRSLQPQGPLWALFCRHPSR